MKEKKYIERNGITLKVEVYYSLGGMNYASYKIEPRGFYLSITPVERSVRNGIVIESFAAYSGTKMLLKEVSRKSAKAFEEAKKLGADHEELLIQHVLEKNSGKAGVI